MPQLDIVYTLLTFVWTWIIMITISQELTPLMLPSNPQPPTPHKNYLKQPPLPWT